MSAPGVDVATLAVKANDAPINVTCTFEAESATCTPELPQTQGPVTLTATIEDFEGNLSDTVSVSFTVLSDGTPPSLAFLNPLDGGTVNTRHPEFRLAFDDGTGSGIDVASFRLTLNGTDVTASAVVTPTGATYTTASPLPSGDNTATARIADRAGNVQTAAIRFTISVFEAIADCAPTSGIIPLNVRFRSRGEFTGGSIVRYRWDFEGDGVFNTSDPVARDYTFNFTRAGTFNALLQVTNNLGQTATDTCTIVASGNRPTATANASPSNGPIPLDVNFTCVGSNPDGSIALYEWDFEGDGVFDFSSTTSGSVTHTYTQAGTFTAICRVTDNDGQTATARTTTTIIRPAHQARQAPPGPLRRTPAMRPWPFPSVAQRPMTVALCCGSGISTAMAYSTSRRRPRRPPPSLTPTVGSSPQPCA